MAKSRTQIILDGWTNSRIFRKVLGTSISRSWIHLPTALRFSSPGQAYGKLVHSPVLRHAERAESFGTFFLRNKAELELMRRLLDRNAPGSSLDLAVLAC